MLQNKTACCYECHGGPYLMHMCITVSGRQRRLSHGPPDSSIPCDAGATTRSRIRVGTGKAALHRNAGLPCTGGWIEDTRPVRRRFLSHPPRPTLSSPRREAGPASAASRPASLKPSAGESAAQAAALLGNSPAEDAFEVFSHAIVSRS